MKRISYILITVLSVLIVLSCEHISQSIAVTSILLSEDNVEVVTGETITLIANVFPSNATEQTVIWSSSNESVATVNNGIVSAIGIGKATITAQCGGKEATCVVTVSGSTTGEHEGTGHEDWD
jgi:uncharacterized protein YjdB